ncbi:MAG: hypothetical protein K0R71_361 [Bacillales bacterium]|jgi:hypothetical protein|nr:hypothetical protein [Bacillales bacterium]
MERSKLVYSSIEDRLNQIIEDSWDIFIAQSLYGRLSLHKEASFQHHFSNIISQVGTLYCFSKKEVFHVDLEYSIKKQDGFEKNASIDIICELSNFEENKSVKAAIELKHTTKSGDATDIARISSYQDIFRLEKLKKLKNENFRICKFYMLANRNAYTNISSQNTSGEDFPTHEGYCIEPGKIYRTEHTKVGNGVELVFEKEYKFSWRKYEEPNRLYFLSINI